MRVCIFIRGSNLNTYFWALLAYWLFARCQTSLWMPWIIFTCVRLGFQLLEHLWWLFLMQICKELCCYFEHYTNILRISKVVQKSFNSIAAVLHLLKFTCQGSERFCIWQMKGHSLLTVAYFLLSVSVTHYCAKTPLIFFSWVSYTSFPRRQVIQINCYCVLSCNMSSFICFLCMYKY